jgi:hypothetical protein
MIRFNNFPPERPEDVELTEASLVELRTVSGHNSRDLMVAYGSSIAHTIVSSMTNPTREAALEMVRPLSLQATQVLMPEANDKYDLATGMAQGIDRELGLPPAAINKFTL